MCNKGPYSAFFLTEGAETRASVINTPTQLLTKSCKEDTRPEICVCANSAAADVRHEMSAAQGRDNVDTRNKSAKKKGMKSRKLRKTSGGPERKRIS